MSTAKTVLHIMPAGCPYSGTVLNVFMFVIIMMTPQYFVPTQASESELLKVPTDNYIEHCPSTDSSSSYPSTTIPSLTPRACLPSSDDVPRVYADSSSLHNRTASMCCCLPGRTAKDTRPVWIRLSRIRYAGLEPRNAHA